MIRVVLPPHLRGLAHVRGEVELEIQGQVTQRSVLDALEASYPMLRGTIRDHVTQQRRPFLRFFACEEDLSHELPDAPLPDAVVSGKEPLLIIGAIAGVFVVVAYRIESPRLPYYLRDAPIDPRRFFADVKRRVDRALARLD